MESYLDDVPTMDMVRIDSRGILEGILDMTILDWLKRFAKGQFRQTELNGFLDWLEEKGDDRVEYISKYHFVDMRKIPTGKNRWRAVSRSDNLWYAAESFAWNDLGRELAIYLLRTSK